MTTAKSPSGRVRVAITVAALFFAFVPTGAGAAPDEQECCSDPGVVSSCWWADADHDGVMCYNDDECPSGECSDEGLCTCSDRSDCYDGVTRFGVCTAAGICGPSYCDGYLVCSCWGGCESPKDLGDYSTPRQMCGDTRAGYPGFCCEGNYPSDSSGKGRGYCSPDPTCDSGCTDDAECDDGNPCTVDTCDAGTCSFSIVHNAPPITPTCPYDDSKSADCVEQWCMHGSCEVEDAPAGGACADAGGVPDGVHADCYASTCDGAGQCVGALAPFGAACDDGNGCSATSVCDAAGQCNAETPVAVPLGDCCDPANSATFDDGNDCTADGCDVSDFTDTHLDLPSVTSCVPAADSDDACGYWHCDGAGTCIEEAAAAGTPCDSSVLGGTGGANSECSEWTCSATTPGDCEQHVIAAMVGQYCDGTGAADTCSQKTCTAAGDCEYEADPGVPVACSPEAPAVYDPCCEYYCNFATHTCDEQGCASPAAGAEQCGGEDLGTLGSAVGSSVAHAGTNRCTDNDYEVSDANRFASCGYATDGETVYQYAETTDESVYGLRHTRIDLTTDGTWTPLMYTSSSCDDTGAGPDEQSEQISCAAGTTLTTGPYPLRDRPDSSEGDGIDTQVESTTWLFVDSRTTETPSGGDYDVDLTVEEHVNDRCDNEAAQVHAPLIDPEGEWKTRFRGTLDGHENFFNDNGGLPAGFCWDGGAGSETDPRTAFFRVDLPSGSQSMTTGTDWDHTYKIYSDPQGVGGVGTTLSWLGSTAPDTSCTSSLSNLQMCRESGALGTEPREIVVDSADVLRSGWLAVTNETAGQSGDYELNVLRVPRQHLGMSQFFVGAGSGLGCGCGAPPSGSHQAFGLGGTRLDFVPTNDDVGGFFVTKTAVGTDWLVGGGDVVCQGVECSQPADTTPLDFGFQFPYSGDVWPSFCLEAAGKLTLAKDSDECENKWDVKPNTTEFLEGGAPAIAPLWGSIAPCSEMSYSTPGRWKLNYNNDGDLVCAEALCIPFVLCNCYLWSWGGAHCQVDGTIRKQLTTFEGTTAMVVTWEGFDGFSNPVNNTAQSIDFQVILRVDGRITFFYGPNTAWEDILNANGWLVGLSGGRSQVCATDDECDAAFGTTGLTCDTGPVTEVGPDKEVVWEPRDRCLNTVYFTGAGAVPVAGTWQGE